MALIDLQAGSFSARVSTSGGLLLDFSWLVDGRKIPLLRPAQDHADARSSACYPLVPFGNRVRNNRFAFEGRTYSLCPTRPGIRIIFMATAGWANGRFCPAAATKCRSVTATKDRGRLTATT